MKSFEKPPNFARPTYHVGYLYFADCLVVDYRGRPIRPFRDIPLTLSSKIEGWRVEAIRRPDSRISHEDLSARMCVKIKVVNGQPVRTPFVRKGAISAKSRRYREASGTVTWESREGSKTLRDYFWSLLPQECKDKNLAMPRDLTEHEKAQVATINLGKYPKRARKAPALSSRKRMTHDAYIKGVRDKAATAGTKEVQQARKANKTRRRRAVRKTTTSEDASVGEATAVTQVDPEPTIMPNPYLHSVDGYLVYQYREPASPPAEPATQPPPTEPPQPAPSQPASNGPRAAPRTRQVNSMAPAPAPARTPAPAPDLPPRPPSALVRAPRRPVLGQMTRSKSIGRFLQ